MMVPEKITRVEENRAREDNKMENSSSKIHQQQPMTQIFNRWNIKTGNESLDSEHEEYITHICTP